MEIVKRLSPWLILMLLQSLWSETDAQGCGIPVAPTNGDVAYSTLTDGSVATYTCALGFMLNGATSATCIVTTWSNPAPLCQPVDCGTPTASPNSAMTVTSTFYMDTCLVSCDTGYYMTGSSILTCMFNGLWDYAPPICTIVDCMALVPPMDGMVDTSAGTTFNQVAAYSCNLGFSLSGTGTRLCQASGVWSDTTPFCLPDVCTPPFDPTGGVVTCTSSLIGGTCSFTCDAGHTHIGTALVTCLSDGTWDLPPPTCEPTNSSSCVSQWASPATFKLLRFLGPQFSYSFILSTTVPSILACVRMCGIQAQQACGQGNECSLVMYDPIIGQCYMFYQDPVSGLGMACPVSLICYGDV